LITWRPNMTLWIPFDEMIGMMFRPMPVVDGVALGV
jgi:hypothetical protein